MKVDLEPGKYVVAVSGGVDSIVLLDLLVKQPGLDLVVAHFYHGIRPGWVDDMLLVKSQAELHNLPFFFDQAELGPNSSEEQARDARYKFLRHVMEVTNADAIVTAHHQDDLIETAILNIMRGTHRKGLTSLGNTKDIRRPMLGFSKDEIINYAQKHGQQWNEDETNKDKKYLRNYIRHEIIPKLSGAKKQELIELLAKTKSINKELDEQIANFLQFDSGKRGLGRQRFANLPHAVALEIMAGWLRQNGIREFDSKNLNSWVTSAKTLRPGKTTDINGQYVLSIEKDVLALRARDR